MGRTGDSYNVTSSPKRQKAQASNWPRYGGGGGGSEEEEESFMSSSGGGPVKLTPGWEDTVPPPFDDITKNNTLLGMSPPPRDKLNIVYLILVIHGIGTLMPWNMFITAKSYFEDYKLKPENIGNITEYSSNFMQTLGFASQIPNVFFNWFNIFVQIGGNLKTRIVWSIAVEAVLFIGTVALAMIDTFDYPAAFFYTTMGMVVLINMANGVYQSSIYGIASKFDYAGAVVLGSNISGTFTSLINLAAIWLAPSQRTSAIYYFITALFVLLLCFDTFFALPLNRFYRYHEALSLREEENKRVVGAQIGRKSKTPYWAIFKKCAPQCFNVFLIFFVTLSIFPAVHSDVKMSDENFIIEKKYYMAVLCFVTFNVSGMIGSFLPVFGTWPGPRWLWLPVTLRLLFIPFFLFCNYQPSGGERIFPVLITNDYIYWMGGILLGLTNGYYSSLGMIYCPRAVSKSEAPVAGMFGAASLITGIFVGVLTAYLPPILVTKVTF